MGARRDEEYRCHHVGKQNDLSKMAFGNEKKLNFKWRSPDHCQNIRDMQKQACDCVPQGELDKKLVERVEDFFRVHDPSHLNKKGHLKNKKLIKTWKGKKPELMQHMITAKKEEAVQLYD